MRLATSLAASLLLVGCNWPLGIKATASPTTLSPSSSQPQAHNKRQTAPPQCDSCNVNNVGTCCGNGHCNQNGELCQWAASGSCSAVPCRINGLPSTSPTPQPSVSPTAVSADECVGPGHHVPGSPSNQAWPIPPCGGDGFSCDDPDRTAVYPADNGGVLCDCQSDGECPRMTHHRSQCAPEVSGCPGVRGSGDGTALLHLLLHRGSRTPPPRTHLAPSSPMHTIDLETRQPKNI